MNNMVEIILLCEAVATVVILAIVTAVIAALKVRKKAKAKANAKTKATDRLYDPYGLYAPISCEELAALDALASGKQISCPPPAPAPYAPVPCAQVMPCTKVVPAPYVPAHYSQTLPCETCFLCPPAQTDVNK